MENFCRVRAETIEPLAIFRPVTLKFCRQNGPRFGVQKRTPKWRPLIQSQFDLLVSGRLGPRFGVGPQNGGRLSAKFLPSGENSASFDCFRRYATEVLHTAGPLGSHGFAAPRAIVLHALRTFMPTPVLELGRPTLATLESTAFLALGFGAVNGQDFPTRRDPLGRFTLFLISQLVSGSRVSLTQGRAGPAGVETAGREHGSCNHAVGE